MNNNLKRPIRKYRIGSPTPEMRGIVEQLSFHIKNMLTNDVPGPFALSRICETGKVVVTRFANGLEVVDCFRVVGGGYIMYVGEQDKIVYLFDIETGELKKKFALVDPNTQGITTIDAWPTYNTCNVYTCDDYGFDCLYTRSDNFWIYAIARYDWNGNLLYMRPLTEEIVDGFIIDYQWAYSYTTSDGLYLMVIKRTAHQFEDSSIFPYPESPWKNCVPDLYIEMYKAENNNGTYSFSLIYSQELLNTDRHWLIIDSAILCKTCYYIHFVEFDVTFDQDTIGSEKFLKTTLSNIKHFMAKYDYNGTFLGNSTIVVGIGLAQLGLQEGYVYNDNIKEGNINAYLHSLWRSASSSVFIAMQANENHIVYSTGYRGYYKCSWDATNLHLEKEQYYPSVLNQTMWTGIVGETGYQAGMIGSYSGTSGYTLYTLELGMDGTAGTWGVNKQIECNVVVPAWPGVVVANPK